MPTINRKVYIMMILQMRKLMLIEISDLTKFMQLASGQS